MKLYMDVCCLNRPYDIQNQYRICLEAEAVLAILAHCKTGEWELVGSDTVEQELSQSKNNGKLDNVMNLYSMAGNRVTVNKEVEARARVMQGNGIKMFDSFHLALAEVHGLDVFLTTDDAFLRAARRMGVNIMVENPAFWYMEVMQNGC